MSEVALPQPVPNISSTATMVSAADCLINGEASLSQPQSQIQPHLQSQLPSQSRKRSFDGARNYDEGTANGDSNEIESERKTDAGFPSEVMIHKAGNGEACGTIGGDSEEPHQQTVFGTASTSAIAAGSATAKEGSTPLKRRKVTPQEKEEKKLEKEERERERAEMRARKDKERKLREDERRKKEEEKKLKEDERRKKAEEREEERKLKEEERRKREEEKEEKKREKEAERLMIEEEKKMKERAQPKLHSFFVKPKDSASVDSPGKESASAKALSDGYINDDTQRDGNSGYRLTDANAGSHNGSPRKSSAERSKTTVNQAMQSDYESCSLFSPTQLEPGRLAHRADEVNNITKECADIKEVDREVQDAEANEDEISGKAIIRSLLDDEDTNFDEVADKAKYPNETETASINQTRGYTLPRVRDLMTRLQNDPIDLSGANNDNSPSKSSHQSTFVDTLKALPVKYLHFAEDVRPPYFGTFTRLQSPAAARSLGRNPLSKQIPHTNYEYDSEAEWEEPEEGEDIQSDEEDDDEEEDGDGEDDIATFLDDEEVEGMGMGGKRKMPQGSGDLEPVCTGLWWEDGRGLLVAADANTITDTGRRRSTEIDFSAFKMGYLIDRRTHSINPYSTEYWSSTAPAGSATAAAATSSTLLPSISSSSATTSLLNPATLLKHNSSATVMQPNLLVNGMSKKNIQDGNNRQRRQPLQSRPVCTIVNGGVAINKDKSMETGPETDADILKTSLVIADGARSAHTKTDKHQTGSVRGGNQGNPKPQKRFVTADELPAFCAAIEGSCLTKIALVEELKRKFPKIPKDAISNSVGAVAERKGAKEVEKRWVLLGSVNV